MRNLQTHFHFAFIGASINRHPATCSVKKF